VLRWGIPDAVLVWVASVVAAAVVASVALAVTHTDAKHASDSTTVLAASVLAQYGVMLGGAAWVSRRKGRGSVALDFGLRVRWSDWTWALRGLALQLVLIPVLAPLSIVGNRTQSVVKDVQQSSGGKLAFLALTALVFAPFVEELLFRGMLLRALARRVRPETAVALTGLAFGMAHLLDPNAISALPGLVALGMISSVVALRTGDLSRSIFLHMGFNALGLAIALHG
jgi:uncharacterized protein